MGAIAGLQLRQILGEKKVYLVALILAGPVLLSAVFSPPEGAPVDQQTIFAGVFLYFLYPQSTCLLLALLYGSAMLSSEVEGKTLTYLFTRSIPKWKIFLAKYLAIAGCLLVPSLASFTISWFVIGSEGGVRLLLSFYVAIAGAVFAYTAIFFLISVFFRKRPMIVGLIYAMIEFLLSFIPAMVSTLTTTYFLRSIVARVLNLEIPVDILRVVGSEPLATSVIAVVLMSAGAFALAAWTVTAREHVVVDAV